MNTDAMTNLEEKLNNAASAFEFPPTPDIARGISGRLAAGPELRQRRRLAWGLAMLILLIGGLLAVSPVRAQVLNFLRIGAVRIFLGPATPTATPPATPGLVAGMPSPITATPAPQTTFLPSLLDLAGETTLAQAQKEAGFPIKLPTYPPDLGLPERVFLQENGGKFLVLVWLQDNNPGATPMTPGNTDVSPAPPMKVDHSGTVRMSLHEIGPGSTTILKYQPTVIQETQVGNIPAVWAVGPYLVELKNGNYDTRRLVQGGVLIWEDGDITYRLETNLPLEEALRIAASLR